MTTAIIEQGREWARGRTEGLAQGISALETQVAELELMISRTPAPLRALGKYFHFGPAEELYAWHTKIWILSNHEGRGNG